MKTAQKARAAPNNPEYTVRPIGSYSIGAVISMVTT